MALAGAAGVGLWASRRSRSEGGSAKVNPYAYDVEHLSVTDPKLLRFEEVKRFRCARPEAKRLEVGPGNKLYVAAGRYIAVMDLTGNAVGEVALGGAACCLAVGEDSTVYVGLRDHVEVYDSKGQRVGTWDSPGKRAWLTGLALGGEHVYVADAGNRIVFRHDRSGKVLGRIGQKDPDKEIPGFVIPSPFFDLSWHRDGLLRVANPGRHRVEAYTPAGDLELAWGKASAAVDGFCGCCNPIGLAVLPEGRIVTCEKGLPRVKVYESDGTFESVVAGPESFKENAETCDPTDCTVGGLDATVDMEGRIYILDLVANDIRVMARKAAEEGTTGVQGGANV